jgi:type IV secretion system protein VirD4
VAAVTQLLTWKKSIICLDPSTELAPQVEEALTDSGRRVIRMGLGDIGFNVLDAIVPGDPEAETRMAALVRRMIGDAPKDAGGEAKQWKDWGKQLILAILADMIWSDGPSEAKTLQQMRSRLALPEDEARKLLENIHKNSPNRLARENAAIYSLPQPTFGGVLGNAHRDTGWISNESYAKLVSGNRFNPADITKGDLAVFLQIPEDVLEESPYVARVLIGSMMEAQFKANGSGDWTFLLVDDAVIMDSEPLMRSVLNLGGKHKIVVQYNYQSESQIERVWGGEKAKNELFASLAWRSYTRVQELSTAKSLSEHLGRYGVVASSRGTNKGRSGPMMGMGSASSGSNTNEHDIGKNLMDASEILSRMRTDERVVLLGGSDALRVSSAIGMRRPEIRVKLGLNPYANR